MPKFFVISDVHGFYDEMINALNDAGFDKNNENHWLISCGDHFDRGTKPYEVMKYLMGLERWIGVKGNHESLLEECCERGYWGSHDISNGTFDSICELGCADLGYTFDECCDIAWKKVKPFFNKMVNYFESKNFVFCHGFLPVNCNEDWHNASQSEWEEAMWLNGMKMVMDGFGIEKCVVVGHYHTSWGHAIQDKTFNEFGEGSDFSPFYYNDKLIAIDGCCAYTGQINCLVLDDDFID